MRCLLARTSTWTGSVRAGGTAGLTLCRSGPIPAQPDSHRLRELNELREGGPDEGVRRYGCHRKRSQVALLDEHGG